MSINYLFLGLALLLLWFPRQWLRLGSLRAGGRGRRQRAWSPKRQREPGDLSIWFSEEIRKPRNWVDLLRALAGGYAIGQPEMAFTVSVKPEAFILALVIGLQAVILVLGLLVQTLRIEGKATLFAPLFYLQGLAFGLVGWKVALFAVITAWVINNVLPSVAVFLFVFASLLLSFGMVYEVPKPGLVIAPCLVILPGLLSLIFKRRLAQFTKKTKIIGTAPPASPASPAS